MGFQGYEEVSGALNVGFGSYKKLSGGFRGILGAYKVSGYLEGILVGLKNTSKVRRGFHGTSGPQAMFQWGSEVFPWVFHGVSREFHEPQGRSRGSHSCLMGIAEGFRAA